MFTQHAQRVSNELTVLSVKFKLNKNATKIYFDRVVLNPGLLIPCILLSLNHIRRVLFGTFL